MGEAIPRRGSNSGVARPSSGAPCCGAFGEGRCWPAGWTASDSIDVPASTLEW